MTRIIPADWCTYHVYMYVQKTPGHPTLTEECACCHHATGRTCQREELARA